MNVYADAVAILLDRESVHTNDAVLDARVDGDTLVVSIAHNAEVVVEPSYLTARGTRRFAVNLVELDTREVTPADVFTTANLTPVYVARMAAATAARLS